MDVGYARVSTLDQDTQIQINDLERAGCHPIYQEKVSGVAKNRPVRDQVLAQLQAGDTLSVWKLDRLGRNMVENVDIIENLVSRGVRFRVLTQNVNISAALDPMSKMQLQLLGMFAEFERAMLLERTAAGKARRLEEGKHPGGPALFGWKADHETVDEDEAQVLNKIASMILDDGLNMSQVVERLNDEFPPPRRGGHWRVTSLHRILTNPRTEAVIPDRFTDLQRILRRNDGKGRGQGGGRPADHLLSGILICGRDGCGQPLYSARQLNQGKVPQRVYRCKKGTGSGGRFGGCGSTQVSQARADAWAEEAFIAAVVSPDFAKALTQRQNELLAGEVTAAELDAWREEMADIETVLPTRFGTQDMKRRHDQLQRQVRDATARLMAAPELEEMLDLPRTEKKLRAAWASWTITERRAWLRRLLHHITVKPATVRGRGSKVEKRLAPVWRM